MAFLAGNRITAARLNRLQPATYSAVASGPLDMTTTTETDIPGAAVTFTTDTAGASFVVHAVFDALVNATSGSILMIGKCNVDGVNQSGTAIHAMDTLDRDTVAMHWTGTLGSAGTHTIKLRGNLSASLASGGTFVQADTRLSVVITETV